MYSPFFAHDDELFPFAALRLTQGRGVRNPFTGARSTFFDGSYGRKAAWKSEMVTLASPVVRTLALPAAQMVLVVTYEIPYSDFYPFARR